MHLHQSLTDQQRNQISYKDLDCMVNWMLEFILEDTHLFNLNFIFKYGMPGKWPTGEYGYTIWGDMGMHIKPVPKVGDHRVSMRYDETPNYQIKLGSLYEVTAPCTNYYHRDFIMLENPQVVIQHHLAALSRAIPNYMSYLVYKIFIGSERAKENWYIKDWFQTYIEPSDGAQNGYRFYLHQGKGSVNLSDVINKPDKKDHPLKTKLENINKELRADGKKVEVDVAQNDFLKTAWPKNNLTDQGKKTFALFHKMCLEADKIRREGRFETKYKHKNDDNHWKDYIPMVSQTGSLFGIMNSTDWKNFMDEVSMSNPVTSFVGSSRFPGTFIVSDLLDSGEGFIIQDGLLQCWILPSLSRYGVYNYENEQTRDFIYDFGHTIDKVDIFCSMYFKLKG